MPIFKDGRVVGGIGVTGVTREAGRVRRLHGQRGRRPDFGPAVPFPGAVILEGVRLPFVHNTVRPAGVGPG